MDLKTIFNLIKDTLLEYPEIYEVQNKNQLSFYDENGVVVMLRNRGEELVVAFGRGVKMQKRFPMLQGRAKVVRHLIFKDGDKVDLELIKALINESLILGIEAKEKKG